MAIKINKIRIENFKVFSSFQSEFEDTGLVVLDGPNGFGKTSFYDAVELLVTGSIRRYNMLRELIIDGRSRTAYLENPYLHTGSPAGDILIKAELNVDDKIFVIARSCVNADIQKDTTFTHFKLYRYDHFDDLQGELVPDENNFLTEIFDKDYKANFEFLNYVEQEENVHLLKHNEKDKKVLISHLFNVAEFSNQIEKYEAIRKKLLILCNADAVKELQANLGRLSELKKSLKEAGSTEFKQLFPQAGHLWDQQEIKFGDGIYTVWFGEEGDLSKLRKMFEYKPAFQDHRFNKRINDIINAEDALKEFLRYAHFIRDKETIQTAAANKAAIEKLISYFEGITSYNLDGTLLDLLPSLQAIIKNESEEALRGYQQALKNLRGTRNNASNLSKLLADLQSSREQLIIKFRSYREHTHEMADQTCPLCGYVWPEDTDSEFNTLFAHIDLQTAALQEIVKQSDDETTESLKEFQDRHIEEITAILKAYAAQNMIDPAFLEALKDLELPTFERREKALLDLEIDYSGFLNMESISNSDIRLDGLMTELRSKMRAVDPSLELSSLEDLYNRYFRNDEEAFQKITLADIDRKIQYIDWRYAIFQNELISRYETMVTKSQAQFGDAKLAAEKIKALIDVYKTSLENYNKTLIRDIEILFHIYSGRIVQDFQGGLGLFIKEDKGIKFLTDPSKSHDAVFSMSSGQLAALMISFTLALNKKYSKNMILFIDDPIQSMDELNIAGLIEVLRNDFNDRQIFISTHEDMMSTFMRYKFEKFNLKTKRINMKTALS
jgi:exonuclease SbcC